MDFGVHIYIYIYIYRYLYTYAKETGTRKRHETSRGFGSSIVSMSDVTRGVYPLTITHVSIESP